MSLLPLRSFYWAKLSFILLLLLLLLCSYPSEPLSSKLPANTLSSILDNHSSAYLLRILVLANDLRTNGRFEIETCHDFFISSRYHWFRKLQCEVFFYKPLRYFSKYLISLKKILLIVFHWLYKLLLSLLLKMGNVLYLKVSFISEDITFA